MNEDNNIYGLGPEELKTLCAEAGEPPFRSRQLYEWLYVHRAGDFSAMTSLPSAFREYLSGKYRIALPSVLSKFESSDGSSKYLLGFEDGNRIEAVLMPSEKYTAICVSSQAGCAMNCAFCATGGMGLKRNLTAGDIIGQVSVLIDESGVNPSSVNILFMGMGEPLDNFDNVIAAFNILHDGFNISAARMTLSTAGIVPGIIRLSGLEKRPELSISLNACTDELRSRIMPLNRRYNLDALLSAARHYTSLTRSAVTFEYVLLKNINDSVKDAALLADIAASLKAKVNLISYNAKADSPYGAPSPGMLLEFQEKVRQRGVIVTLRRSRGSDIGAACGQLSLAGC